MIDKARQAVSALEMSAVKDMSVEKAEELRGIVYQSLDNAEKNKTILHVLGLHLKNRIRVQRFFQAYVLIINDGDTIINLNEDEYNALKEWLENEIN